MEFHELGNQYQAYKKRVGFKGLRKIPYWLRVFATYLEAHDLCVQNLSPLQAEGFQIWLGTSGGTTYSSGTVSDIIATVDGLYRWLVQINQVPANPFEGMKRIKRDSRLPRNIPSMDELTSRLNSSAQFWKHSSIQARRIAYRIHVMAEVLYASGLRIDELAQVKIRDIDVENQLITVGSGKGGKGRTAFLTEYAAKLCKEYLQVREIINFTKDSTFLFGVSSGRNLDQALNGHLKKIFGISSHGFRHALGTHLLAQGCDLRHIQIILGHEDLKSTAIYTKVSKEALRSQLDMYHPCAQYHDGLKQGR